MLGFFRTLFGGGAPKPKRAGKSEELSFPTEIVEDDPFAFLNPPNTVDDPAAWDRYWCGLIDNEATGFVDLFCNDGPLVDLMRENGFKTVLCVGSGISHEARALAGAGFDVTAMDLSPFAVEVARTNEATTEFLSRLIGERSPTPGGTLRFVVGDLRDTACCPGPYDVVIERRTLQLFPDAERPAAFRAVTDRLASPGLFFTHTHDGKWRPPAEPWNPADEWLRLEGWPISERRQRISGRMARTFTTTG